MTDHAIVYNITGSKVALGPYRKDLIPLYQRWMNDLEGTAQLILGDLRPETLEDAEERYDRMRREVAFTMYARENGQPIGCTNLRSVNHYNRTAEFGIVIGEPEYRGKGLGTEATRLTLDWAFHGLGLHNVMLTVFEYNTRAIRAYEKAGFKLVGRRREAKRLAGQAYDIVIMDCVATEFEGSVVKAQLPNGDRVGQRRARLSPK